MFTRDNCLFRTIIWCHFLLGLFFFNNCNVYDLRDAANGDNVFVEAFLIFNESSSKSTRQGCAYYGGALFVFHDSNDIVEIYDINHKRLEGVVQMSEKGLCHSEYHCNNANFGNNRYEEKDFFPLLYVSMEHRDQHKVLVFRVLNDRGKYTFDLVQTIILPDPSIISLYYLNSYIDCDNNSLWISGYSLNTYNSSNENKLKYIQFSIPDINGDAVVGLKESDIQRVNEYDSITATQGGCFSNGQLFQVFGIYAPYYLVVFDLYESKIIHTYQLVNEVYEPEGLFIKDGTVYYTTSNALKKISFH